MNRFTTSENLLPNLSSGKLLALTAPFVIDQNVLTRRREKHLRNAIQSEKKDPFLCSYAKMACVTMSQGLFPKK